MSYCKAELRERGLLEIAVATKKLEAIVAKKCPHCKSRDTYEIWDELGGYQCNYCHKTFLRGRY